MPSKNCILSSGPYLPHFQLLWWGVVDCQKSSTVYSCTVRENVAIKSERVKAIFRQKSSDITHSCLFMTKTLIWTWSSLWTCAIFNSSFLLHLHVLLLSLKLFYKQLKLQRLIPPQENRAEAKNRRFFGLPRLSRLPKLSGFLILSKIAFLGKILNSEKHSLC